MPSSTPTLRRTTEWLAALVLTVLTLPLVVALATASAVVYRTSPFFVHERIGKDGQRFSFVKIRTLPPTMARYAAKQHIGSVRVPLLMQLVRRTHLDELPQLWLVLTGHLSLVGPRPEMAMLHERIPATAAAERTSVRPGITGLWQVSVHCDGLICDRVEYDRLYVQHRTPLLDAWILWRTAHKMLLGRRVHLFDVPQWAIRHRDPVIDLRPVPEVVPVSRSAALTASHDQQPAFAGS